MSFKTVLSVLILPTLFLLSLHPDAVPVGKDPAEFNHLKLLKE